MITVAIVTSSLKAGGMERVASQLANNLAYRNNLKVVLISLSSRDKFYELESRVIYHPCQYNAIYSSTRKAIIYIYELRKAFRKYEPKIVLSFGDRYNHFTLLASIGFSHQKFISNRQNPHLSNGKLVDFLNHMTYRWAHGIIAQTRQAKQVIKSKYYARNVDVIPNPIKLFNERVHPRENIILNVGRFGDAKNQFELVEIFSGITSLENWEVHFFGDGPKIEATKNAIEKFGLNDSISIHSFTNDIEKKYGRASIFAFVSRSEGFPNALAEAMANGCACISYDCMAGPADIIDNGVNGFLIPEGDHEMYKEKLALLMGNEELRFQFGKAAREKMKQFDAEKITQRFLDFMLEGTTD